MDHEMEEEYNNYWETKRFYEELDSWGLDEVLSSCFYDSSSPECPASSPSSTVTKNTVDERNRRRKTNEKLYALRSVVPNITKMDKASIVKDAIDYIQQLQLEEKRMTAEVAELEAAAKEEKASVSEITQDDHQVIGNKRRKMMTGGSLLPTSSLSKPCFQVTELKVCVAGDRALVISITCNKKSGTLMNVCEIVESLNLNIISANITSLCGSLLHTLFVVANDMTDVQLKRKIEAAIAEYDTIASPTTPMSFFSEDIYENYL